LPPCAAESHSVVRIRSFGKRTDIRDAHDKYANQEVAYLLERLKGYNGVVTLASKQRRRCLPEIHSRQAALSLRF
jgi:hypothetical protein